MWLWRIRRYVRRVCERVVKCWWLLSSFLPLPFVRGGDRQRSTVVVLVLVRAFEIRSYYLSVCVRCAWWTRIFVFCVQMCAPMFASESADDVGAHVSGMVVVFRWLVRMCRLIWIIAYISSSNWCIKHGLMCLCCHTSVCMHVCLCCCVYKSEMCMCVRICGVVVLCVGAVWRLQWITFWKYSYVLGLACVTECIAIKLSASNVSMRTLLPHNLPSTQPCQRTYCPKTISIVIKSRSTSTKLCSTRCKFLATRQSYHFSIFQYLLLGISRVSFSQTHTEMPYYENVHLFEQVRRTGHSRIVAFVCVRIVSV